MRTVTGHAFPLSGDGMDMLSGIGLFFSFVAPITQCAVPVCNCQRFRAVSGIVAAVTLGQFYRLVNNLPHQACI
jgi:hypothetical protein